jgi:DNA-binding beta-propeller fold protein YncE
MAARGHVFDRNFGEAGSGNGQLDEPVSLAVNEASGNVYVVDKGNSRVEYFNGVTGAYIGQFDGKEAPSGPLLNPEGIAIDNSCYLRKLTGAKCTGADPSSEDVYVIDAGHGVIDKFTPGGEYLGQITGGGQPFAPENGEAGVDGVAVDAAGGLWVAHTDPTILHPGVDRFTNATTNQFLAFIPTNSADKTGAFGFQRPGFAIDSQDNFYIHLTDFNTDIVAKFDAIGELLTKALTTEPTSAVAVELSTDDVYTANLSTVALYTPQGLLLERLAIPGEHGAGIAVDSSRQTLYVVDASADLIHVFPPEPPGPPTVQEKSEGVADVTATSATLSAEVNPRSEAGESATSYRFEYGPCSMPVTCASSSYESSIPAPDGELAPDYELHTVAARLQGLRPHTTFHFRVVAGNSHPGLAEGEEIIFTTQSVGSFALPDNRAWEMVSPIDKHGANFQPISEYGLIQASAAGDAIAYLATAPTEAEPPGNSNSGVEVLSRRVGDWKTQDIGTPHESASTHPIGSGQEYRFFSTDLSLGVVQPFGSFTQSLSPQASEQTAFLRTNYPSGEPGNACLNACYRPLVTGTSGIANVPEGTMFGEEGECRARCGPQFLGASSDGKHVVLEAKAALVEGAPKGSLYEWSDGELHLISVLPNGQPASGLGLGYANSSIRNAISADGSRVVFSFQSGHLYLRDLSKGETILVDAVEEGGSGIGAEQPIFQFASPDGSKVFFTDPQRLAAGSGDRDLYECEVVENNGELKCDLTDLTPLGTGEESADVVGTVPGFSEDGSAVYVVADGARAGATPGDCRNANPLATCNLYLLHDGSTRFIATISGKDSADWAREATGRNGLTWLTARVSPNGRWFAFMSQRSLTGYDNRDAVSGELDEEVYLYDASANGGEGKLVCASCNPTGARPHGAEYGVIGERDGGLVGGSAVWNTETWLAANVPGWTPYMSGRALHQSRYLSDSGRLFFNSSDALVPQDTNGTEDVYQYEPPGVGDCTASNPTFSQASGGCVGLISSGTSKEESAFLDASESGEDVFFLSKARLSAQDVDTSLDVYDAHQCTASSPCPPPPPPSLPACEGDACQQPASPPEDPTPASLGFQGAGNLHEPSKTHKKKRHKTKTRKHHKRASHNRGTER